MVLSKLAKQNLVRASSAKVSPNLETLIVNECQHNEVREIGQDFDKDGKLLRIKRCQRCGLLMREYLPML